MKEKRAFVGFVSYYRRYIKDFSATARALHQLTRKDVRFEWTDECQTAFETLKQKLTSAPIVSLPREEGEYQLDTDASGWTIGAVLSQVQDGHERVISYASRLYTAAEKNYCTTRQELLAVVHFTKYFKQYLLGRKFLIRTDHAALQWLRRTPDPVGQQARWLEQLAPYDFVIQHRPGIRHANADGISRIPCRQCGRLEDSEADELTALIQVDGDEEWTADQLKVQQMSDPDIAEFRDLMFRFPDRRPLWSELDGCLEFVKILWTMWSEFTLKDEVLYRETIDPITQDKFLRLVVPWSMRTSLIQLVHDGVTGGHAGIAKTKDQLRRRAYWPGWTKSVERYVAACIPCALYCNGKPPKQGCLQPMLASRPFETLSIDVTGPHPRSANGYMYILTIVDHFSKFAFAYPMRNQEATTVAKILVEQVICLVGTPSRILTDQGPNFESTLFKELCRMLGVTKIRTSPYKPSTNAGAERFHSTLNAMLAKKMKESQRDWDLHVQPVLAAYRASKHASTSLSPNFVIFGRENVMPADLIFCNKNVLPDAENSVNLFVAQQQERFRSAYQIVRDHLKTMAQKRKAYYDASVRSKQFAVGDRVWYFYPRKYLKRSRKWSFAYVGPYTVMEKLTDLTYVIQKSDRDKPLVVHIDKLKKCVNNEISTVNNRKIANAALHCSQVSMDEDRVQVERKFACPSCGRRFERQPDLVRHDMAIHQRVKVACHLCDCILGSRGALRRHCKRFHEGTRRRKRQITTSSGVPPLMPRPMETAGTARLTGTTTNRVAWTSDRADELPLIVANPAPLRGNRTPVDYVQGPFLSRLRG